MDIAIRANGDTPARIGEWPPIRHRWRMRFGEGHDDTALLERFTDWLRAMRKLSREEYLKLSLDDVIQLLDDDSVFPDAGTTYCRIDNDEVGGRADIASQGSSNHEKLLPGETSEDETGPLWDREKRTLAYDGHVIRTIRNLEAASNIVLVLDSFQEQVWPEKTLDPATGGKNSQRVRDTINSLNKGLSRIRFGGNGAGDGYKWHVVDDD